MAPFLLGPPELYNRPPPSNPSNPIPMDYIENGSATYLSAGNPCLNFFFHVVQSTKPVSLQKRLTAAWDFDPLTLLKLLCHLRGVRGTGKFDKEGFYAAALWLFKNHPRTLSCNVGSFADFGYFKDLPEILYRILEGSDVRTKLKADWERRKNRRGTNKRIRRRYERKESGSDKRKDGRARRRKLVKSRSVVPREERIAKALAVSTKEKKKARDLRKDKFTSMAKKVLDRCKHDGDFRFLYNNLAEHFANRLKSDMENLNSGKLDKISLAAKWCPSIDSSFDRSTLLCESIARHVFPRESYPEYEGIEEAHYAYRIRDRLRKEVLMPLHKALELPEVYIGAYQSKSILYNRVPSVALKFYKDKFMEHDEYRFQQYLSQAKYGKVKTAAGALLPHEIIKSLDDGERWWRSCRAPMEEDGGGSF